MSPRTAGKTKTDCKKIQRSWRMGDAVEERGLRWWRGEVEKTRTGRSRGGAWQVLTQHLYSFYLYRQWSPYRLPSLFPQLKEKNFYILLLIWYSWFQLSNKLIFSFTSRVCCVLLCFGLIGGILIGSRWLVIKRGCWEVREQRPGKLWAFNRSPTAR